jgi:hypothetical protein
VWLVGGDRASGFVRERWMLALAARTDVGILEQAPAVPLARRVGGRERLLRGLIDVVIAVIFVVGVARRVPAFA